jgi:hypothetical protein
MSALLPDTTDLAQLMTDELKHPSAALLATAMVAPEKVLIKASCSGCIFRKIDFSRV